MYAGTAERCAGAWGVRRRARASAALLENADHLEAAASVFPGSATHWHWPLSVIDAVPAALGVPLAAVARTALRPLTMWWTQGSERVSPSVLLVRALPQPEKFAALLDGSWQQSGWDGEAEPELPAASLDVEVTFAVSAAGATDAGVVRAQNQDNFALSESNRLWAVADGMGGHSHGDRASQMVVDALNNVEPVATLNSALQSIDLALARVNADLHGAALAVGESERSGSTVVVLVIRGAQWGISWAGDSRAYLLRDAALTRLTIDHSGPPDASREITRAVGGDATLELDSITDHLVAGDRFLLCSDGLYMALDPAALLAGLADPSAEVAAHALIANALAAGAQDNVTAVVVDVHEDVAMTSPQDDADETRVRAPAQTQLRASGVRVGPAVAPAFGPGYRLRGRYLLDDLIGQGAMGQVWRAKDLLGEEARDRNPYAAVKVLNSDFESHPDAFVALHTARRRARRSSLIRTS